MSTSIVPPVKRCTKCGEEKPQTREYFSTDKRRADGLQSQCHACKLQAANAYYATDKGKEVIRQRNQRPEVKKKHAAREHLRFSNLSPEEKSVVRAKQRAHYEQNKERILEKQRLYNQRPDVKARAAKNLSAYKKTPKGKMINIAYKARRRARQLETGGTVKARDIRAAYRSQKGRCWHCGVNVGDKYHVDHLIPLVKGGSSDPRNLVISCATCNHKKGGKYCWEFNGKLF
jgi:5-methylcytosine-specific restriction endonuclease McrA